MVEWVVAILYTLSLAYLCAFSLGQLHLAIIYRRTKVQETSEGKPALVDLPVVTIQLPVYNEKYVIERLIDAVVAIDYPSEKLEIQILDDSTDETSGIIFQKLEWIKRTGRDIKHIRRESRKGFKAGALAEALEQARGEYIAIFDADFIPAPDFLRKTLPYFADAGIGAVQTRWGHINKDYSMLTRLQAFGLDAHFSVEQSGRNAAGSFINFNGTCGIWRKSCIVDAGGWSDDTLTEDLDLSYRAQLKGWRFHYLEDVVTPGELPVVMPIIKLQQYRWNKGAAETARKMLRHVLHSPITTQQKIHAVFHLNNSSVFVALFVAAITSVPMLFIKDNTEALADLFRMGVVFLLGFLSVTIFYWTAITHLEQKAERNFLYLFPAFLIVAMGLSLHNTIAVLEGWLGIKTPFLRTPKFNIVQKRDSWAGKTYLKASLGAVTILEGVLSLMFSLAFIKGIEMNDKTLLLFHAMLALGFGVVFLQSVKPWANA